MGNSNGKKKKVFVAMSGGVDSSVAAYLLKKQGNQVIGVYMKNWSDESFSGKFSKYCPWKEDLADVKKVAKILKIPVKVFDFQKEYEKEVIKYFFDAEKRGLTPNPDIICNKQIKFGLFLSRALKEGADSIATGHYVSTATVRTASGKKVSTLKLALDKNKDQSYFLCLLKESQIKKTLFPLGSLQKSQVRQIAKKLHLPNALKPESMGICFVGEVPMKEFLKARFKETPGPIITSGGKVLGKHIGLPFYTVGQRKGLNIPGINPWYVVKKNVLNNSLIAAQGENNKELYKKNLAFRHGNFIFRPQSYKNLLARTRHRQELQKVSIGIKRGVCKVIFKKPQRAITPGQYCALYEGQLLVGGGEIFIDENTA